MFAEYGRADIIVNNAGSARGVDRVPVVDLPLDVWRNVININLHGTFFMSRTFAQRLIAQGQGGSIVNISSIGGKLMPANAAAYAASKAAIHSLTSSMAKELGKYNIRVNAICPGIIDTSRMDDVPRGDPWNQMVPTTCRSGGPAAARTSRGTACTSAATKGRGSAASRGTSTAAT